MDENTNRYYIAAFNTDLAKTLRMRIGRAKPGVPVNEARAALNDMVGANALDPEYGNLLSVKGLQYVAVTRTPFDVA